MRRIDTEAKGGYTEVRGTERPKRRRHGSNNWNLDRGKGRLEGKKALT